MVLSRWRNIKVAGSISAVVTLIVFLIYSYNSKKSSSPFSFNVKVPNVVHFALIKDTNVVESRESFDFIGATAILSAFLNHKPEVIYLHTNIQNITGKYWTIIKSVIGDKIKVNPTARPSHVFGSPLSSVYHATDIIRIRTLHDQGGIFLDLDTFVVQPLNSFFDNDCTIGWPEGQNIGTQVIIAKPRAAFLHLWLLSYKEYRASMWYYNAGESPTKNILEKNPDLVTRIPELFGVQGLSKQLYRVHTWKEWRSFYTIHLLARHRTYLEVSDVKESGIDEFNEKNIQDYKKPFGEIARSIWNREEVKPYWQKY